VSETPSSQFTSHRSQADPRRLAALKEAEGCFELATLRAHGAAPLAPACAALLNRVLYQLDEIEERWWPRADSQRLRGEVYRYLGRFDEAVEPLSFVAEQEPEDIGAWLALGWCFKRLGRVDLAIDALEEGLTADPTAAILHYNLACYWALLHNTELAVEYLAQAFEIDPLYRDLVSQEPDFDPIRHDAAFRAVASVIV